MYNVLPDDKLASSGSDPPFTLPTLPFSPLSPPYREQGPASSGSRKE